MKTYLIKTIKKIPKYLKPKIYDAGTTYQIDAESIHEANEIFSKEFEVELFDEIKVVEI